MEDLFFVKLWIPADGATFSFLQKYVKKGYQTLVGLMLETMGFVVG